MANIYIPATDFANTPTRKQARELRDNWPQIVGFTSSPDGPIIVDSAQQPAGYVVHTSNPGPDPDEAAIIADAIALADGSVDLPRFGVAVPLVQAVGDLPDQPPDVPADVVLLAATRVPPALWVYALGAWRGPIEPT